MLALVKKEINTFFATPIGYLVIGLFLLLNGLFLWVFKGQFNLYNQGLVSLSSFFQLAPWILMFLIPAITMRSFSDEKKQGTLELLVTKPLSHFQIVLGKYFGALSLVVIALIPTLLYAYTISKLGPTTDSLDLGSTIGSYFGLLFLVAAYTAIGVFASALSDNQIVAFLIAVFICFFLYFGFEGVSNYRLFGDLFYLENLGMLVHYKSISRGVIDTRDLVYFISLTFAFLFFCQLKIKNHQ
jgi:ABC-2 type transport system permease protein